MNTAALIFNMDGTMIDSMPCHAQSWIEFALRGVAQARDYHQLTNKNFLESLHA